MSVYPSLRRTACPSYLQVTGYSLIWAIIGYSFSALLIINRVRILVILVINSKDISDITYSIVINMPTRELLAGETKSSFVYNFQHLNDKNNVCKQISSL